MSGAASTKSQFPAASNIRATVDFPALSRPLMLTMAGERDISRASGGLSKLNELWPLSLVLALCVDIRPFWTRQGFRDESLKIGTQIGTQ